MHINDLPDDCILLILKPLPLHKVIQLRAVCSRWSNAITMMCRGKRSLRLFFSADDIEVYQGRLQLYGLRDDTDFKISRREDDNVIVLGQTLQLHGAILSQFLPFLFPNLANLVVYCNRFSNVNQFFQIYFKQMMLQWTMLESLAWFGMGSSPDWLYARNWLCIKSLKSLRRLHLFDSYEDVIGAKTLDYDIFNRLESFTLAHYNADISTILNLSMPKMKQLSLHYCQLSADDLQQSVALSRSWLRTITHFSLGYICPNKDQSLQQQWALRSAEMKRVLEMVCLNFTALTHLHIGFATSLLLPEIMPELARLQHLTSLRMVLGQTEYERLQVFQLPRLNTVKSLQIDCFGLFEHFALLLDLIFPNVEQIQFICEDECEGFIPLLRRQVVPYLRKPFLQAEQPNVLRLTLPEEI